MFPLLTPGLTIANGNFTCQVSFTSSFLLQIFNKVAVSLLIGSLILKSHKPLLVSSCIERRIHLSLMYIMIPNGLVMELGGDRNLYRMTNRNVLLQVGLDPHGLGLPAVILLIQQAH